MLFPDGAVPNYDNLAMLINAGIRAVREASSDIKVMIHLDQGGRYYYLKEWFDNVFKAGMEPIDAIGISYYSFWHGTFMDLRDTMAKLIERYKLPVYVVETAHPWRHCKGEHVSKELMETAGLPAGIKEQKTSLSIIMQIASQVSKEKDTGVYYWEPLCYPGKGYGSWDENMGMIDEDGKALSGFEIYKDFNPNKPKIKDLDAFIEQLYKIDEKVLIPSGENLISNGSFEDGLRGWWSIPSSREVLVKEENEEIYVSSKSNFTYSLVRELRVNNSGKYKLMVDYRGTNTTDVKVKLFLKCISYKGEEEFSKDIFPTDVRFVTYGLDEINLEAGTIQIGIKIDSPPIFGRIRNFRLIKL